VNAQSCILTVGLTGGIAVGKSTVDAMFEKLGAHVIDADAIVHELLAPGGAAAARIIEAFGPRVASPGGGVGRDALGAIVFSNPTERKRLEEIVHPLVTREIEARLEDVSRTGAVSVAIVDASLLVETGAHARFDRLVVVTCSEERQVERLIASRGLSREDALSRVRAQASSSYKSRPADYIIVNDGDLEVTRLQVERVYLSLVRDFERKWARECRPDALSA
jgi:dephospho-CoA kinase